MPADNTVTGASTGRPAHAARPGVPAAKVTGILIAAGAVTAGGLLGAAVLLKSSGPTGTTPESAKLITVSLTPSREHPGLP